MPFDRAAILREAHANARFEMASIRAVNPSATYMTYRKSFAAMLRCAWQRAKDAAEDAAYEASLPQIPEDVAQRIREIEADAWLAPITSRGNDEYTALMRKASLMREEARDAAIAARKLREAAAEPADQFAFTFEGFVPCPRQPAVAAHLA